MPLLRRTKQLVEEVKASALTPVEKAPSIRFNRVISTGSTLLDLAVSGGRVRGGGVPGGIVMEIFSLPGLGKTALLIEMLASAQLKGGDVHIDDPEARLDQEYAEIYGAKITEENYARPNTVSEIFKSIWSWKPEPKEKDAICLRAADSLAALSTDMELKEEDGDKRGQRRAKEFSEGLRKTCRLIANKNWLIACTNQIRTGDGGYRTTPGGWAMNFYSSLRIEISTAYPDTSKIMRKETLYNVDEEKEKGKKRGKKLKGEEEKKGKNVIEKQIGIRSVCKVVKSSLDDPFREADIYILFGHGISDIWGNLQYLKDMTGTTRYVAVNKEFQSIDKAIKHIEDNNLEKELRENVINLWEEIQRKFNVERKKKVRF